MGARLWGNAWYGNGRLCGWLYGKPSPHDGPTPHAASWWLHGQFHGKSHGSTPNGRRTNGRCHGDGWWHGDGYGRYGYGRHGPYGHGSYGLRRLRRLQLRWLWHGRSANGAAAAGWVLWAVDHQWVGPWGCAVDATCKAPWEVAPPTWAWAWCRSSPWTAWTRRPTARLRQHLLLTRTAPCPCKPWGACPPLQGVDLPSVLSEEAVSWPMGAWKCSFGNFSLDTSRHM